MTAGACIAVDLSVYASDSGHEWGHNEVQCVFVAARCISTAGMVVYLIGNDVPFDKFVLSPRLIWSVRYFPNTGIRKVNWRVCVDRFKDLSESVDNGPDALVARR